MVLRRISESERFQYIAMSKWDSPQEMMIVESNGSDHLAAQSLAQEVWGWEGAENPTFCEEWL